MMNRNDGIFETNYLLFNEGKRIVPRYFFEKMILQAILYF